MEALFKVTVQIWLKALPVVALSAGLLHLSPRPAIANTGTTVSPPGENRTLLAQDPNVETVLYFETDSMAVRVYRRGSNLFMNLYNRRTDVTEVSNAPTELVPNTQGQTVYTNRVGAVERFARINVLGESELEIVDPSRTVVLKEPGSDALVGVPSGTTDFQGNNFAPGTGAVVISSRYAKLRQQPDLDSSTITTIPREEGVVVVDRVGNPSDGFIWYKVTYQDETGWVRGDLLQAR
ncbi:MAG TPA: SH3 domain-containing protein [Trichocoleus sp.]